MSDYSDKLKDPRWLERRIEILARDGNTCTRCGATDVRLEVHHTYYEMGMEPWEYEPTSLITVCVPCHGIEDDLRVSLRKLIGCVPPGVRDQIFGYVHGQYKKAFYEMGNKDAEVSFAVPNVKRHAIGIADAFGFGVCGSELFVMVEALGLKSLAVSEIVEMVAFIQESIKEGTRPTDA